MSDRLILEKRLIKHICKEGKFAEMQVDDDEACKWLTQHLGEAIRVTFERIEHNDC